MKISRYFDAAVLKSEMTPQQVEEAIREAIAWDSYSVCVRGCDIDLALELTRGTNTSVGCVLDFPYGYGGLEAKRMAARAYAAKGVEDIDMVMNYGAARGGAWDVVEEEIRAVVEEAHAKGVIVKVIFETSQLNARQIARATEVCIAAGADFVKTSTGFLGGGATVEAVQTMLETAQGRIKVKPSGGIRDYETARKFVDMGVHRLGLGYGSCRTVCEGEKAAEQ